MSGALRFMALPPDAPFDRSSAPPGEAPVVPEAEPITALAPKTPPSAASPT
jgi:hypothetical protein